MAGMDVLANISLETVITTIQFTMDRIDDWNNVVPEGKALRKECDSYKEIIVDLVDKPELPISNELNNVYGTIKSTNILIARFLKEDERTDRSALGKAGWKIQRAYLAYSYREHFKATTKTLKASKEEILKGLEFAKAMATPTAYNFKSKMVNEQCFKFWKEVCGQELHAPDWSQFTKEYQRKFDEQWSATHEERVRRVACSGEENHLSIAGYISLTKKCGFPLNYEYLPQLMDTHTTVSAQTRMNVARMINELIIYYSSKKMRDLLVAIFTWYKGCNRHDKEAWQGRANEWAETIKANRGKPAKELDERGRLAEQVDMARRTYSFFFQRYMVVFKIGQLSKEMFAEVDFPGKARMHEFKNHVGPLDKANFLVVMNNPEAKWESKRPKVYKFLEEFLADKPKEINAPPTPAPTPEEKVIPKEDEIPADAEKQPLPTFGLRDTLLNGLEIASKNPMINGAFTTLAE
ncbi:hypothetical protein BCR42DRAFT_429321 [Absidia repens]|uniref:Uncharacterized protein n=1 Tax=Absidia repens TaxID=90262 RepID=A0A1X2HX02_9FUNG|nr:hypothetical protein BCR42DRAFT_429321 [Absidia repens]